MLGRADLLVGHDSVEQITLLRGGTTRTFGPLSALGTLSRVLDVPVGDVTGTGDVDVMSVDSWCGANALSLLEGEGDGDGGGVTSGCALR